MTQRERPTPDGGVAAPPDPTSPAGAGLDQAWDATFLAAAPSRRQELLDLAARQGVLYGHQLPPPGNGPAHPPLSTLLNGCIHDLPAFRPSPAACGDARLDSAQRDAVARAVQTPDLYLIQGHPGSGKSRTAAEVVAQAVARGERVLLLAPTPAAVDCVLERLEGRDGVYAARCLGPGERPETLAPGLRRLVVEERLRLFREEALPAARRAAAEAAERCARRREDTAAWEELDDLARRSDALSLEANRLAHGMARIDAEVEAGAAAPSGDAAWQQGLAACRAVRDEILARLDARLAQLLAESEKACRERQAAEEAAGRLGQLADARRAGRWWTWDWWRARREGDLQRRLEALQARGAELKSAAEQLGRESEERAAERAAALARYQEAAAQLFRKEADRRRAEVEQRLAVVGREQEMLRGQAQAVFGRLSEGAAAAHELSTAAVAEARRAWERLVQDDERRAELAAQWAEAAVAAEATMPERLTRCVNVVGAVTSALAGDPHFGDRPLTLPSPPSDGGEGRVRGPAVTFDLLVLEESHLVTESEFLAAARRASRWVLLGEPGEARPSPSPLPLSPRGRGEGVREARPSSLRPGFFGHLWQTLHAAPASLPCAWSRREGRLACRLRLAAPGEEKWVRSEHLADRPEIELRIAAPPRTAPQLLEVVFPGETPIQEAKGFIFRELGELPVQARGKGFRWREESGRLILDVSDGEPPHPVAVELDDGVRERVGGGADCCDTCALEFDEAAGWTRELAGRWVEEHLSLRDPGRTAVLDAPHRSGPALAAFLSGLLFDGACRPRSSGAGPGVEFVPVPPLDAEWGRRRSDAEGRGRRGGTATVAPRLRSSRGGAGLEIDLADPRRLDPLPPDLRAALPRQGLVNLFEARAVVRKLEALVADAGLCAAAAEWAAGDGRTPGAGCGAAECRASAVPCVGRRPALAVLALYPAQAELIRLLASRSAALTAAAVPVEIATPDAFRQRECFAGVVSLTRSHSHRAVTFGDDPSLLSTALTRAASRLILFGDPGTLARRAQWNGPVDHLDEAAAERERGRIAQVVAYLHGHGPHPFAFGIDESGRA